MMSDTTQTFPGTFTPPIMGESAEPIKITGSGSCTLHEEGLQVSAFRHHPKMSSSQVEFLFFGVLFFSAIIGGIATVAFQDANESVRHLIRQFIKIVPVGIMAALIHYGNSKKRENTSEGAPINVTIPWDRITRIGHDDRVVQIRITKFRHQEIRFNGDLYFEPTNGTAELLEAFSDRGFKLKPNKKKSFLMR